MKVLLAINEVGGGMLLQAPSDMSDEEYDTICAELETEYFEDVVPGVYSVEFRENCDGNNEFKVIEPLWRVQDRTYEDGVRDGMAKIVGHII